MVSVTNARKVLLHPWQYPQRPQQRLHVDYAGPILDLMYAHSKWPIVVPTKHTSIEATI